MSYIGNQPFNTAYLVDSFSGNGSTSTFNLSLPPASPGAILVTIGGILQDPAAYGIVGRILTFTGIPPTGSNNITVRYLGLPASNVTTTAYRTVTDITAAAGQTTFATASYTPGFIEVFRNGVRLAAADYTATNGATVVLVNPAVAGDTVTTVSFFVSGVLNAIPGIAGSVSSTYLADASVTTTKLANGSVGPLALDTGNSNGTGAITIPSGTTAQRPTSPILGQTRWNTTLSALEVFIGNSTWQISVSSTYSLEYLIVAGGGGGGCLGGGGGGGGVISGVGLAINPGTSYTITVGGGAVGGGPGVAGGTGGNTTGFGYTAIGGGGGGSHTGGGTSVAGTNGGSGGGASDNSSSFSYGTGTAGQGNRGGSGSSVYSNIPRGGGGGGGAGGVGLDIGSGGHGGPGFQSSILGTAYYWGGGGGYGGYSGGSRGGDGGLGGGGGGSAANGASPAGTGGGQALNPGGNGVVGDNTAGGLGGQNTGGGGGCNGWSLSTSGSRSGGSGIVVVRYLGSAQRATGGTVSFGGGYVTHTFLSSGVFVA
jgi:hypothetical protein